MLMQVWHTVCLCILESVSWFEQNPWVWRVSSCGYFPPCTFYIARFVKVITIYQQLIYFLTYSRSNYTITILFFFSYICSWKFFSSFAWTSVCVCVRIDGGFFSSVKDKIFSSDCEHTNPKKFRLHSGFFSNALLFQFQIDKKSIYLLYWLYQNKEWQSGEHSLIVCPCWTIMDSQSIAVSAYGMELPFRESVAKLPSERTAQVSWIQLTGTDKDKAID